jgi:hypothetical protein
VAIVTAAAAFIFAADGARAAAPTFTSSGPFSIPESVIGGSSTINGTSVGIVIAEDLDGPGSLVYTEVVGGAGESVFSIDSVTGEITVEDATGLNFEVIHL